MTLALSTSNVNKSYTLTGEEINFKGRADLIIDLNKKSKVVIELKVANNKTEALRKLSESTYQIKNKDYGNNGLISYDDIKRYTLVFYEDNDQSSKFAMICNIVDK